MNIPFVRFVSVILPALFAMLLFVACTSPVPTQAPRATANTSIVERIVEKEVPVERIVIKEVPVEKIVERIVEKEVSTGPGSLVVYSSRSESLVAPIVEMFSDVTGIGVEVRYGKSKELVGALLEDGANSPADVFFAQDAGSLGMVDGAGLMARLPGEISEQVDPSFRSPTGSWVGTTGRTRVVVYNTNTMSPETLPADIWAFTEPEWDGRIGWAPTNGSFQVMVAAMHHVWGKEKTREWLEGIQANNPKVYPKNTPIVAAAAAGEIDVGFVNHYYLYRFIQKQGDSFAARNYDQPEGGPSSLVMLSGAGRLDAGKNEANAIKFIDFLLSPVAQQFFAGQTYEYPLVEGAAPHREVTPLEDRNVTVVDPTVLTNVQPAIDLLTEVGALQ